jgi:hypothetical protein
MIKSTQFISLLTILVVFSVPVAAENPGADLYPPKTILRQIAEMESSGACSPDYIRPLRSQHFAALDRNTLLILLELPDYLCDKSNSIVPLLADVRGRWVLGDRLPGLPFFFEQGPDGALWLVTQWQIEGTYPSLFRSKDGLHWHEIPLPPGPQPDSPFVFLDKLCFQRNEILIRLTSEDVEENPKVKSYSASQKILASRATATWQPLCSPDRLSPCSRRPLRRFGWRQEKSHETREIIFYRNEIKLILPGIFPRP